MTLEGSLNCLGIVMYGINSVDDLRIVCSIAMQAKNPSILT